MFRCPALWSMWLELKIIHDTWGLAVDDRDWTQLQIQQRNMGINSQGTGWGSVDRKLLRGSILAKPSRGYSG